MLFSQVTAAYPDKRMKYVCALMGNAHFRHINPLNAELNPICHLLALL